MTPTLCFGGCADTQTDPLHCGGCDRLCPPALRCTSGICCLPEERACNGLCADLQTSLQDCGKCGVSCQAGAVCEEGQCCSQGCSFLRFFGGSGSDYSVRVALDSQGSVYLSGHFDSPKIDFGDNVSLPSNGRYTMYLTKLTSEGQALWARPFYAEGANNNEPLGLAVGPSGDIYVAGNFTNGLQIERQILQARGLSDIFVARLTATGDLVWAVSLGGAEVDSAISLAVAPNGDAVIVGETRSKDINGQAIVSLGNKEVFLARVDATGKLLWVKTSGGNGDDSGRHVRCDAQGNAYLTGVTAPGISTFGSFTTQGRGTTTAFLAKVSPQGDFLWVQAYDAASRSTVGNSIAIHSTPQGEILYLAGQYEGSVTFGKTQLTSKGGYDGFLMALDTQGKDLWAVSFGGAGAFTDYAWEIGVDSQGRIHVAGVTNSPQIEVGPFTLQSQGAFDLFVARFDPSGQAISAHQFGGSASDRSRGIAVSPQGDAYIVGNMNSGLFRFLGKLYPRIGGDDAFLMRLKRP